MKKETILSAHGVTVEKYTLTTYKVKVNSDIAPGIPGQDANRHTHRKAKAERNAKQMLCRYCKHFVKDEDRNGDRPTIEEAKHEVFTHYSEYVEIDFDWLHGAWLEWWVKGCSAGQRKTDGYGEDNPPPRGAYTDKIPWPCPGYEPVTEGRRLM